MEIKYPLSSASIMNSNGRVETCSKILHSCGRMFPELVASKSSHPCACLLLFLPIRTLGLLLLHLDLGWPCDLLWQGECGRSIVVPVLCHHKITLWWWLPDIVLKMHGNFSFNSVGSQSSCIEAWAKLGGERETAWSGPDSWVRPVSVLIKLPVPVTSWVNPAESSQNTNERNNKELLF